MEELRDGISVSNNWESIAETVGTIGWCFYHRSNFEVYEQAAKRILEGCPETGNEILTEYWDRNVYLFKWELKLNRLYYVDDAFLEGEHRNHVIAGRLSILKQAVTLYHEKRYVSSIPLILSQLDGICLDTTGELIGEVKPKKFFGSSSRHLEDNVTLAGHHSCLKTIQRLFSTNAAETSTDD